MRFPVGVAILLAQLVMIGVARVHPIRFYTWAPFDSQNEYRIDVSIGGRALTSAEIRDRYRILDRAVNPRSLYEVVSLVEYVESKYRFAENAHVSVRYRTNGSPEQTWRWPQR